MRVCRAHEREGWKGEYKTHWGKILKKRSAETASLGTRIQK